MIQQNQVVWRGAATYITTNLLQWNKSSVEWLLLQLFSGRSEVKKWYAVKSKRRPTHALLKDVLHSNCLVLFTSYIYIYIFLICEKHLLFLALIVIQAVWYFCCVSEEIVSIVVPPTDQAFIFLRNASLTVADLRLKSSCSSVRWKSGSLNCSKRCKVC